MGGGGVKERGERRGVGGEREIRTHTHARTHARTHTFSVKHMHVRARAVPPTHLSLSVLYISLCVH